MRGRSSTGVWTRYCGTAAKAGGKQRTQTSPCSSGRLLPTRREVYRARDGKLGRDVAIKVLPDAFAQDAERLARFKREAKVLASLNHPNIASIYGLEQSEGTHYLVLELVEGETLAERIARGPIPVEEAHDIANQITDALEEAHERGIVHRDLKPANIKLTPDGKVKVLDFGLAKAFVEHTADADSSMSPTITRDATRVGVILGTAAYMSPEQAKGKRVDKRSDIWAFGAVLYEMLVGRRAFEGEDISDTLAAVLRAEPDFDALPAGAPAALRHTLKLCLVKDVKHRLSDVRDVRLAMDGSLVSVATAPSKAGWHPPYAAAGALAVGILAGIVVWGTMQSEPLPGTVTRFSLTLPPGDPVGHPLTLSPDGTQLAYTANDQLYHRYMDQTKATPVAGTEGARDPVFSPDGRWLAFWADGKIKKVSITGAAPVTLASTERPWSASWPSNDAIILGNGTRKENRGIVLRLPATGGEPEVLVPPEREKSFFGSQILPGGEYVLLTVRTTGPWVNAQIVAHHSKTGEQQVLIEGGTDARYVPTGHLVYAVEGTLLAVPFDRTRLEVTGGAVPVVEDLFTVFGIAGAAPFAFADNGTFAYVSESFAGEKKSLVWVDREGNGTPFGDRGRAYQRPRLSPDGKKIAFMVGLSGSDDSWTYDIEREVLTRFTFEGGVRPIWTPEGDRIVFTSNRHGFFDIFWKPLDGPGELAQLTEGAYRVPASFSPNGDVLVFRQQGSAGWDIGMLRLDERNTEATMLLDESFNELQPAVSPDGRWLAYTSDESGRFEVFVQSFPELRGKKQVSSGGGREPVWKRDGTELFYREGDKMMSVATTLAPDLFLGRPELLFESSYSNSPFGSATNYDIAEDGRFLMVQSEDDEAEEPMRINVVLNWFEELKARVPTEK